MNKLSNNKGFTLIELIIVIAVIGILSAIAIPVYQTYIEKADLTDASTALISANQNISQRKLNLFNSNLSQADIKAGINNAVSAGSNLAKKFTVGGSCSSNDCLSYYLYAKPKTGNIHKSVWLGGNDSTIYFCENVEVSTLIDASQNSSCSKQ